MSKIKFYKYEDITGKVKVGEDLEFGSNSKALSRTETKLSSGLYSPGEWISDFLSLHLEDCKKYIEAYNFDENEISDYMHPYYLFNSFLNEQSGSLEYFQRLIATQHISVPVLKYEINEEGNVEEVYLCNNMLEFCTVLMHNAFKLKKIFKKCENCGKWFVPKAKSDEKYCLRQSPQYNEKDCRSAARLINTLSNRQTEEARMERNIRQMFYNNDEDPTSFNIKNKEWKDKLKNGIATRKEYNSWLKSNYKRKFK